MVHLYLKENKKYHQLSQETMCWVLGQISNLSAILFVLPGSRWSHRHFKGWKNGLGFAGSTVWVCYSKEGVGGSSERCLSSKICPLAGGHLWETNEWGRYHSRRGHLDGRSTPAQARRLGLSKWWWCAFPFSSQCHFLMLFKPTQKDEHCKVNGGERWMTAEMYLVHFSLSGLKHKLEEYTYIWILQGYVFLWGLKVYPDYNKNYRVQSSRLKY